MWDQRYNEAGFVYGVEPNDFLKSECSRIQQQSPLGSPQPFRQHFLRSEKVATEIVLAFNRV
ncbi:hypothetical protein GCM10009411_39070 [Shewanella litoralis]|uniref:Uncharacterized protein n=1 Tax=Shewanella litoralis TaxID=2282700 RepID=A0ABQ2RP80_9GAMM|nr:hypothetical protein GCM10009411_39070 [Shewanella litoralis]